MSMAICFPMYFFQLHGNHDFHMLENNLSVKLDSS